MKQQMSSRTSGGGAAPDLSEAPTTAEPSNQMLIEQIQQELANQPSEESSTLLDQDDSGSGTGGGTAGLRMGIPLADVIYEQLAHRAAYLQFPASLQLDRPDDPKAFERTRKDATGAAITKWADVEEIRKLIDKLGYTPKVVHDDPLTGFQAILFQPTINGVEIEQVIDDEKVRKSLGVENGLRPVVAFRGSQDHRSWADDFNPEGVGTHQFAMNEAQIVKLLTLGTRDGTGPDVTGHSLGGALAQLAASHYPGLVGRCVTFQAPGISKDDAQNAEENNIKSTHYRVKGDLVPVSGEAHTWGNGSKAPCFDHEDVSDTQPTSRYTSAHVAYPLEDIHAGADDDKQPFIPALQKFHDAHDADRRDPEITEVTKPPPILKTGYGEPNRLAKMGAQRLDAAEDWLNGPTVELSERLRSNLAEAYRTASYQGEERLDCDWQVESMRRFVEGSSDQVVEEALTAWYATAKANHNARDPEDPIRKTFGSLEFDKPPPPNEALMRKRLLDVWPARRQRLIEQTATLIRMQLGEDAWMKKQGKGELQRRPGE